MSQIDLRIKAGDPLSEEALFLLREAAWEARQLYSDLIDPAAPMPSNQPLQAGGVYLIAFLAANPVGCGALRKMDTSIAEVRRMYVLAKHRRAGIARAILRRLEEDAHHFGYSTLVLETGNRQCGFTRIDPFGPYVKDPTSVCYSKPVAPIICQQPNETSWRSEPTPL
jgi:putative acetyltransferase